MKTITVAMWDPGSLINESLNEKVDLIIKKFKEAYDSVPADPAEDNTFIFLCPEFTLANIANLGGNVSYSKQEFKEAETRFRELAKEYPNAIIVPGTVYLEKNLQINDPAKESKYVDFIKRWQRENLKPPENLKKAIQGKNLIKNTAPIFFHSEAEKSKKYSKKYEANEYIDPWSSIFYPGHGSPFFTKNDIRFGIEICVDHQQGSLSLEQKISGESIDVHLIVANTISTIPANIAHDKNNVIVINCAGNFSSNSFAAAEAGVFVCDGQGDLVPVSMSETSTKDLRIFTSIPVPEQRYAPGL